MTESEFNSLSIGDTVSIDQFPPARVESVYFHVGEIFKVDIIIADGLTIPGLSFKDAVGQWELIPKAQTAHREGWDA